MKVIEDEDLVDQQLISELRKEYGMTYNDFFMVLTDTDMKVKVRVSTLSKKRHWKNMKNRKILGNYTISLHVRPIRDWCRTWSLLDDKKKDSKRNFQELGSYLHFLQLGNCGFLLEWWADTVGTGPATGRGFNAVPGILKCTVWPLNEMTVHCIWTMLWLNGLTKE